MLSRTQFEPDSRIMSCSVPIGAHSHVHAGLRQPAENFPQAPGPSFPPHIIITSASGVHADLPERRLVGQTERDKPPAWKKGKKGTTTTNNNNDGSVFFCSTAGCGAQGWLVENRHRQSPSSFTPTTTEECHLGCFPSFFRPARAAERCVRCAGSFRRFTQRCTSIRAFDAGGPCYHHPVSGSHYVFSTCWL
ncbi:atypical/ABC1/ABC1-C protein kinase [Anopheles sinensis]|uniref:Atypical/ABC1/ABC1-C protein kinase n=1 Tax=Anopheles sinensis TaxID=74873 RepID=A0A084W622_ANOSI|nr:atypical/ABC1/ABC1-C protein kinase [Anopheles sinensis]